MKMAKEQLEVISRYPRMVAMLIAHSLGYFTPGAAANAIVRYKEGKPFFCEWYSHMAMCRAGNDQSKLFDDSLVLKVGKDTLNRAFKSRKSHRGDNCMGSYARAAALVKDVLKNGEDHTVFASWF